MALSQLICLILIRWIENYPMNSAIRRLNKPGLGSFLRSCRFWGGGGGEWSEEKEAQLRARQTKLPAMQATKRIPPVIVGSLSSPKQLNVAFNHFSTGWHPLAKYDTVLINLVTFWTWYLVWTDTHRTSSVESGLTTHQRHWEPEKENNDIVETGINYLKKTSGINT